MAPQSMCRNGIYVDYEKMAAEGVIHPRVQCVFMGAVYVWLLSFISGGVVTATSGGCRNRWIRGCCVIDPASELPDLNFVVCFFSRVLARGIFKTTS